MGLSCDILYIHATANPTDPENTHYSIMPMGLIGMLNRMKSKGIRVMGLNYAIERHLNPQFDLKAALADMEYGALLVDLHWYEHSFGAIYTLEQSKKVHPHIPTVIGGYTSTIYCDEIMENFPCVDYIVTGDSDLPMDQLVDHLLGRGSVALEDIPNLVYRKDGTIVKSRNTWVQTTLDDIDFVSTDVFKNEELVPYLSVSGVTRKCTAYWLCVARGCKFNCAYCCGSNANMEVLFRRCNVLTRSPAKVAADFVALDAKGIVRISPSHDFRMLGKAYYKEVFAEIRKTGIKPGMYLELFQLPDREYLDDILQTFDRERLVLVVSPISGNEALRRKNGKLFSNDELLECVRYMATQKVPLQLYYTINLVGETRQEFMETYVQMKYLHLVLGLKRQNIAYQHVVLDPLAGMREFKEITVEYDTFLDYYNYCKLPSEAKRIATGYRDGAELTHDYKVSMYKSIFE